MWTGLSFSVAPKPENNDNNDSRVTKVVLSDRLLATTKQDSSLETNIEMCDVALTGEIVDINNCKIEMKSGTAADEEQKYGFPTLNFTKYKVKVNNTYIGKTGKKYIEYYELGDLDEYVTKPTQKEKVFLFLNKRGKRYCSVNMEHSIFTISDSDEVYSYSNVPELCKYDGKSLNTLIRDVR